MPVTPPDFGLGCTSPLFDSLTAAAGRLILYEAFGFTTDRRARCGQVPGGAWFVDPDTGALGSWIVPELYLSTLIADRKGALFGLSAEGQLVRIDAKDGQLLKTRALDPGFWRMAVADLREIPSGDVRVEPNFGQE